MEVVRIVQTVPGERVVAVTRGRELAVTTVLAAPVLRDRDRAVRDHVLGRAAADLPPRVAEVLDGYRARAALGPVAGVPDVIDGGVVRIKLGGLPPLAGAYGHPYVTVRATPGSPLPQVRDAVDAAHRAALARAVIRLVDRLHRGGVAHGALAPESLAAAGAEVWLVELGPLRPATAAAAARDRDAAAQIAAWLGVDAGGVAVADATERVPDVTVFVPDAPDALAAPPPRRSAATAAVVVGVVVAAAIAARLLM
jgi:hypothetical protein